MTGTTTSTESRPSAPAAARPSLTRLAIRHKRASLAVLAVLVAFVAVLVIEAAGRGSWKVTDSTSCSTWSSANGAQQRAYARLYVVRHGSLANGATALAKIEAAVNNGCVAAFAYDEADSVTVLQAIQRKY